MHLSFGGLNRWQGELRPLSFLQESEKLSGDITGLTFFVIVMMHPKQVRVRF
jgi:hypothetical protein